MEFFSGDIGYQVKCLRGLECFLLCKSGGFTLSFAPTPTFLQISKELQYWFFFLRGKLEVVRNKYVGV